MLFLILDLPLELRQRVYDFYLEDFNLTSDCTLGEDPVFWRSSRDCHYKQYYRPIIKYSPASYRAEDDCKVMEPAVMPIMQTELATEIRFYFLRDKLAVEFECLARLIGWLATLSAHERANVLQLHVITDLSIEHMALCGLDEPAIVLQLKNKGQEFEVRSKWKMKARSVVLWGNAFQNLLSSREQSGKKAINVDDVTEFLDFLAKNRLSLLECDLDEDDQVQGRSLRRDELCDILASRIWTYKHIVCKTTVQEGEPRPTGRTGPNHCQEHETRGTRLLGCC